MPRSLWTFSARLFTTRAMLIAALLVPGTSLAELAQESSAQSISPMEKVITNWESRSRQWKSARYHVVSHVTVKRGEYNEPDPETGEIDASVAYPPQDFAFDRDTTLLVDFVAEKMRWEVRDQIWSDVTKTFRPQFTITIFDGKTLRRYSPPAENTSATYKPGPLQSELMTHTAVKDFHTAVPFAYRPLLFGHGSVLPALAKPPAQSAFMRPAAAASLISSSEMQQVDDKPFIVARLNDDRGLRDEFRVAMADSFPMAGWTIHFNQQPWQVFEIAYEETPQGSFPKQWTMSGMFNGTVKRSTQYEVVSRELNVPVTAADFAVAPQPAAVVIEDGKFYKTANKGDIWADKRPLNLRGVKPKSPSYFYPTMAIGLLVGALGVFVVIGWRRRTIRQDSKKI